MRQALLPALCLSVLGGCSSLPVVEEWGRHGQPEPLAESAAVGDGRVLLPPGEGSMLLQQGREEGRAVAFDRHVAILRDLGETLVGGNTVDLLIDGPQTFDAMLEDIARARERIFLQSYIFEDQDIGRRIADALLEKAADGVAVHVVYDSVGSFLTPASFFRELAEGGVEVCEFNPVSPWRRATGILSLNHRDHRKLLLVDGEAAFTGGINVSAVYSSGSVGFPGSGADHGEDAGWRDTHVRIRGPAVSDFARLFADTWQRQDCANPPEVRSDRLPEPAGERLVVVIGSTADEDSSRFYRALLGAIRGAERSIHITMAYFVPDPQSVQFLADAARRGVEVTMVLPGFSDSRLALNAGRSHYTHLLGAGVRIFELHETLLHAKTVVIDGVWSTVGSSNLDFRSFLHNDELNAIVLGREFGLEMERQFEDDLSRAKEVTLDEWRRRGPVRRFMEGFGRLWEYWL